MQPHKIVIGALLLSVNVFLGSYAQGQQNAEVKAPKQTIWVKVIGARTESYIQKRNGNFGPPGTRARVVVVQLQVPQNLEVSTMNPHPDQNGDTVDETFYTLQDRKGKQYMDDGFQELNISAVAKNNIQTIRWATKDTPIASRSRKSLRFKVKLYFFNRQSKGDIRALVGVRNLDIPVTYKS